jgi:hypothetical protein
LGLQAIALSLGRLHREAGAACQPKARDALGREGLRKVGCEFDLKGARLLVNGPFLDSHGRCGLRRTLTPCREPSMAEGHPNRRLFGSMLRMIAALPLPGG